MNLKSLLKNIICAMVIAEILTVTVAIAKNNNTQKLSQGKQIMLAESTVIEFNEGIGENLTAKLNTETGELKITGTGNMTSWTYSNKVPWNSYKNKIKTVVIEEGVTSIGEMAFYGCSSLAEITIPEGVTSIGSRAFSRCSSLSRYNIPEGITSIERYAFYRCSSLSQINIPEGVTSIGYSAFYECRSLSQIKLPSSVTSIGLSAFYECSSLSKIQVEENNKNYSSINGILFNKEKTKIIIYPAGKKETSYNIPEGVTSIGYEAFHACRSLSQINIPEGVTSIGDGAFRYCSSLSQINIPEGVTRIGLWAFADCSSLSQIEVEENNKNYSSINGILFNKEKTKIIKYPEGKKEASYNIPEGVTSTDWYAFYACSSLSQINIPEGVTRIGLDAFAYCSSLTINCRSNSYAKEYAVSNNINYTEINPEIISVTGNAEEWTHENVTLKVEAKDTMYGLAEEAYSFDGGTTWQKENTKTYSQNTEGIVIKVKAKDGAIATYAATINITKIANEHVATGEYIIDKGATCEENGSKYKHCVVKSCNEKLEITEILALGHSWKEATCETAKTCERCGKTEGKAKGHTEVIDKKVEPTCTETGLTEGKHCSVCNTVIVAQTEIPALGHNYKDGICTICGEKETIFINTSRYKIENEKYIRNVKLNTTIEEFKKNIKEEYTVKITKDEKNVTTGIIGTGSKVTVSKNGENIGEYIVVVTGDLTGDGKLQNGDLIKLVRHKVELITLEEPYKLAGDINGDGKISDSDIIKLARVLVRLEQL